MTNRSINRSIQSSLLICSLPSVPAKRKNRSSAPLKNRVVVLVLIIVGCVHSQACGIGHSQAFVGSIMVCFKFSAPIFASPFIDKYGCQNLCRFASLISVIGFAISAISPNLLLVGIGYGVCGGCVAVCVPVMWGLTKFQFGCHLFWWKAMRELISESPTLDS